MIRGRLFALAAVGTLLLAGGCGGDSDEKPVLRVSAAASLTDAFTEYAGEFADARVRPNFAGSDQLAAQIRESTGIDVYAAANTKLPDELHADGKVRRPVVFAGNRLVIAVKAGDPSIRSVKDLERAGLKLVIGTEDVPVGSYTREVLRRLPAASRRAVNGNVVSNEPDVTGIVGKLTQGAADAGFLYATDVTAANGRLKSIELPDSLEPSVRYGVAVVTGTKHPAEAQSFISGLLKGGGREALRKAGFTAPQR